MKPYQEYAYQHAVDQLRVVDFVRFVRPAPLITEYPSVYDLPNLLALSVNQANARLWSDLHGALIGFAYLDAFDTLRFDLDWQ